MTNPTLSAAIALPPLPDYFTDWTDMTRQEVEAYAREAIQADRAGRALVAVPEPEPMFNGHWHHGNGNLCCGSMRYFRADFDTQPVPDVREDIFDWVCTTMNAALGRWRDQKRARESDDDAPAATPAASPDLMDGGFHDAYAQGFDDGKAAASPVPADMVVVESAVSEVMTLVREYGLMRCTDEEVETAVDNLAVIATRAIAATPQPSADMVLVPREALSRWRKWCLGYEWPKGQDWDSHDVYLAIADEIRTNYEASLAAAAQPAAPTETGARGA